MIVEEMIKILTSDHSQLILFNDNPLALRAVIVIAKLPHLSVRTGQSGEGNWKLLVWLTSLLGFASSYCWTKRRNGIFVYLLPPTFDFVAQK